MQGGLAPLKFEISYFLVKFLVEKCFSLSFKLLKLNFTTIGPLEKSTVDLFWKNPSESHNSE